MCERSAKINLLGFLARWVSVGSCKEEPVFSVAILLSQKNKKKTFLGVLCLIFLPQNFYHKRILFFFRELTHTWKKGLLWRGWLFWPKKIGGKSA